MKPSHLIAEHRILRKVKLMQEFRQQLQGKAIRVSEIMERL